jgi:flagellar protein FlbD
VIMLTRLRGQVLAINPDLIVSVEETPDSVVRLTNGDTVVVRESIQDIIELVIAFRRALVAAFASDPQHAGARSLPVGE